MLVLSRHRDEDIVITTPEGRRIRVTLIDIRGDKCRIGFEADPDVQINRSEIQAQIDAGVPREGIR